MLGRPYNPDWEKRLFELASSKENDTSCKQLKELLKPLGMLRFTVPCKIMVSNGFVQTEGNFNVLMATVALVHGNIESFKILIKHDPEQFYATELMGSAHITTPLAAAIQMQNQNLIEAVLEADIKYTASVMHEIDCCLRLAKDMSTAYTNSSTEGVVKLVDEKLKQALTTHFNIPWVYTESFVDSNGINTQGFALQ